MVVHLFKLKRPYDFTENFMVTKLWRKKIITYPADLNYPNQLPCWLFYCHQLTKLNCKHWFYKVQNNFGFYSVHAYLMIKYCYSLSSLWRIFSIVQGIYRSWLHQELIWFVECIQRTKVYKHNKFTNEIHSNDSMMRI